MENCNQNDCYQHAMGAKYTTQLRTLVLTSFPLGLDEYPIFNEDYRATLNKKIIDHFEFREIGFETPMLWQKYMKKKMNEIMPYYNQLYLSTLIKFDPMLNYKLDSNSNATTDFSGDNKGIYNDIPMGKIMDLFDPNYASSTTQSDTTNKAGMLNESHTSGFIGQTGSAMLKEFRSTFLNIDMEIIGELESLFMQLW